MGTVIILILWLVIVSVLQWAAIQNGTWRERYRFYKRFREHFNAYTREIDKQESEAVCRYIMSLLDYMHRGNEETFEKYPKLWKLSFWKNLYHTPVE